MKATLKPTLRFTVVKPRTVSSRERRLIQYAKYSDALSHAESISERPGDFVVKIRPYRAETNQARCSRALAKKHAGDTSQQATTHH